MFHVKQCQSRNPDFSLFFFLAFHEISYLPADFINGLTEDIMSASLYDYVENTLSLTIDRAAQTLEPAIASQARRNRDSPATGVPTAACSAGSICPVSSL